MAHAPTPHQSNGPTPPPPPPDAENPAILDARLTYRVMLVTAVLFVASAVFIIMRTRMG
jgi:hypothetical protein